MTERVLALIACPVCKDVDVAPEESTTCATCLSPGWICANCGTHFPLRDGEPYFVPFACSRSVSPQIAAWTKTQKQFMGWQADYTPATATLDDKAAAEIHAQFDLPGRVLDIGGGAGMARKYLAPRQEYLSIEPDVSWRARLPVFRQVFPGVVEPFAQVQALAEYLPLRSRSFDSVLMRAVIDHCIDAHLALAEAHRVLVPGGTLVVGLSLGGARAKLKTLASKGPRYATEYVASKGLSYLKRGLTGYGTGHVFHIYGEDIPALLREHDFALSSEVRSELMPRVRFFVAKRSGQRSQAQRATG